MFSKLFKLLSLTLMFVVLSGLGDCGGESLDCFENPELQAEYDRGVAKAQQENQALYNRGKQDGLALTREQGETDGWNDGYDESFNDGYFSSQGYPLGYSHGYAIGFANGQNSTFACSDGSTDGWLDGEADGRSDGRYYGNLDGYDDGYNIGYNDGLSDCAFANAKAVTEEELQGCFNQGYNDIYDMNEYWRGFNDGKRANPDYQAGYAAGKKQGLTEGFAPGVTAGYFDGKIDGEEDGYLDGSYEEYTRCYNNSYSAGYSAGYTNGYNNGYDEGWSDGYDDGYYDALDTCTYATSKKIKRKLRRFGTSKSWKKFHRPYVPQTVRFAKRLAGFKDKASELRKELRAKKKLARKK